jgi:capsular polysaccharide export protein
MSRSLPRYEKAYCPQLGILRKHPSLKNFLPEVGQIITDGGDNFDVVSGWGRKHTSVVAIEAAAKRGVPYLALEDGFLRSLDLGVHGEPPLSLVVDSTGIYYDANRPSDLECILASIKFTETELVQAEQAIARIRAKRLSKYNAAPDRTILGQSQGRPRVLVVDQTANDASIKFGMASSRSFTAMLDAAFDENRDADIIVKVHPDVVAGYKRGHLEELARRRGAVVVAEHVNPWALLDAVDRVYVVTSQLGFEALMKGLPVRSFGMPFYAGWGVTQDEMHSPRRGVRRTVTEIFSAAYIKYSRYCEPFNNEPSTIENIIDILGLWREKNEQNRQPTFAVGMSKWKQGQIERFFASSDGKPQFVNRSDDAIALAKRKGGRIIAWASRVSDGFDKAVRDSGVPLQYVEDGFLRSVGLGASFTPAYSLVIDKRGLYLDPNKESDLEHILQTALFDSEILLRAARLRQLIIDRGISKYNVGGGFSPKHWPKDRRIVLVPGQVEDDLSIRMGCLDIRSNRDLLRAARQAEPDAYIVYKPHPDVEAGLRIGNVPESDLREFANDIIRDVSIASVMPHIHAIHTMTSLVGFEGLLRNKAVFTYGQPFYAGWGLTQDRHPLPRRSRRLTLDELVAGTLILYPSYLDPVTGRHCPVEVLIERLAQGYKDPPRPIQHYRTLFGKIRQLFLRL